MTADDVRKLLARACKEAGSNNAWALKHGVTRALVGAVLAGKRTPGDAILNALGLEKVTIYKKAGTIVEHPKPTPPRKVRNRKSQAID